MKLSSSERSPFSPTTIQLQALAPERRLGEPVTCGIPWPRAVLSDPARLLLQDETGNLVALQTRVLDRWPDNSIRWVLLDWQGDVADSSVYRLSIAGDSKAPDPVAGKLSVTQRDRAIFIDTGSLQCQIREGKGFPFASISTSGPVPSFAVENEQGARFEPRIRRLLVDEAGTVRAAIRLEGELVSDAAEPLANFVALVHFFSGSATVKFVFTLHNPRKAEHPGGLWDLGNGGSIYIKDASLTVPLPPASEPAVIRYSCEPGQPFALAPSVEIYQDSSGGTNWRGTNHVNRYHIVPNSFCGYRLRDGERDTPGMRATPIVSIEAKSHFRALAVPQFWQNFPKAVEASGHSLVLRLFPRQYADVHEIQGGEQKTHTFYVAFGPDAVTEEPLAWCRAPAYARATPEWYCSAGVIPYLVPATQDPNAGYLQLVNSAIEGDDTFEHKREVIDEYGWRHFGDIYGDHEAVFHKGPAPLVSHYNNQYDPIAGFAYQFLRSGDLRWWKLMDDLAAHVVDIDIYHTDLDKSAYNHGLFWHTYHYVDADTGTHRSYPRAAKVCGGGPGNEQNYTTGLMLHHFLTGSPASRQAAIGLARWVIDRDDGTRTIFRWLSRGYTGLASSSRTPEYHGPGRGAANSLAALIDGHRLTADPPSSTRPSSSSAAASTPPTTSPRATCSTPKIAGSTPCSCSPSAVTSITRPSWGRWTACMPTPAPACFTTFTGWRTMNIPIWKSPIFSNTPPKPGQPRTCARATSSNTRPGMFSARSRRVSSNVPNSSSAIPPPLWPA
jgi:hypothetical protein